MKFPAKHLKRASPKAGAGAFQAAKRLAGFEDGKKSFKAAILPCKSLAKPCKWVHNMTVRSTEILPGIPQAR